VSETEKSSKRPDTDRDCTYGHEDSTDDIYTGMPTDKKPKSDAGTVLP